MITRIHGIICEMSFLVVCVVFLGCGLSESSDTRIPQFNKSANAQTPSASQVAGVPKFNTTQVQTVFANATRVVPANRQVVFDFALRPLASDDGPAIAISSVRIYVSYFTAKRMRKALVMSIRHHEDTFGPVGRDEPVEIKTTPDVASHASYANSVRITGSPEELVMDLGLNPMPVGNSVKPIAASHTLIVDFQTGNTLLNQLSKTLEQYEAKHGLIEMDIQKRVIRGPTR